MKNANTLEMKENNGNVTHKHINIHIIRGRYSNGIGAFWYCVLNKYHMPTDFPRFIIEYFMCVCLSVRAVC